MTVGSPYPVAEFGSGLGSTSYLRDYCIYNNRLFYSYDSDWDWAQKMGSRHIDDWRAAEDIYKRYSVVLIDHAPGEHRHEAIAILKDLADIIVVHDTEKGAGGYMFDKIWPLFIYRYDLAGEGAGATALSNKIDLSAMARLTEVTVTDNSTPCFDGHRINGEKPQALDTQYDGRVCDCGRIKYYTEMCGCTPQHLELRSSPNA